MNETVKVLDGGLGSDLFLNGGYDKDLINNDPLWLARVTYENPDAIKQCHIRFINAGSDVITTGSYQASTQGYIEHANVSLEKAKDIIGSSVDIARKAIEESNKSDRNIIVAGSISPYGAILHDMSEYTGSYIEQLPIEELEKFHSMNVEILAKKNVDMFAFETIPALKEAIALTNVLKNFPTFKAWVTFTTKDGLHTSYGDSFTEVLEVLSSNPQVIAVGINCCDWKCVDPFLEIAKNKSNDHQSIIIYPDNRAHETDGEWFDKVETWLNSGVVKWIGGCCLTSPKDISKIYENVVNWKKK